MFSSICESCLTRSLQNDLVIYDPYASHVIIWLLILSLLGCIKACWINRNCKPHLTPYKAQWTDLLRSTCPNHCSVSTCPLSKLQKPFCYGTCQVQANCACFTAHLEILACPNFSQASHQEKQPVVITFHTKEISFLIENKMPDDFVI
jgi:hypothetical protein